jgi:choloylglycine hydrolase
LPTPTATPSPESSVGVLSDAEIATLASLEQVDAYPLYTMHYHGSYDQAAELYGNRVGWTGKDQGDLWGCSLFAALGDASNRLYGRNFDWQYSPALLLFTDPSDGYASVSMVDLAYLVFDSAKVKMLDEVSLIERTSLLTAPLLPFDGMNEQGLVVGMAAVSSGGMRPDPAKETIDSLGIIREMLDHAANVDEAIALMRRYNIDMEGGPPLHYLLADRAGHSALVEFYRGEMVIIPNETAWHLATNFLLTSVEGNTRGHCWRYDAIQQRLAETQGGLAALQAISLLEEVAQTHTQWSVVYGLSTGEVHVAMGGVYESVHRFPIDE